ncbi:MAG: glycerol-3-phosphate dehydrogenase [Gammaproteobacteria bacterium]|nr:glycerol-3-phosphate dehydrogenase [Gammaproteobacteria bacterium]
MNETDLLIIGGGINGAGIARDAAGRGLRVVLCDKGDFGGATSSASTKLIHGGLRYLEFFEFRLVREALAEREVLIRAAPHLVKPLRFIMPHVPGLRPLWMMRLGLLIYDHLSRHRTLPGSDVLRLSESTFAGGLRPEFDRALAYSDCWADDARLVIANARSAAELGATMLPRTRFEGAAPEKSGWRVRLRDSVTGESRTCVARALVNAAGPWVNDVLERVEGAEKTTGVRLVKGSHIVVPRLYDGEHAFILQNDDRRVIFVIPHGDTYSVVGTTDVPVTSCDEGVKISEAEISYLCRAVNRFFGSPVDARQVRWSYAGVRPLHDDGEVNPSKVSRDYDLELQRTGGAHPLLNVYGGKLTTYRRLAEHALDKLSGTVFEPAPAWTGDTPLPGGDIPQGDFEVFLSGLEKTFGFIPGGHLRTLARRHGSRTAEVLGDATSMADLGTHFTGGLYAREVDYLREREWARTAEDVLFRRTKCGLDAKPDSIAALENYLSGCAAGRTAAS